MPIWRRILASLGGELVSPPISEAATFAILKDSGSALAIGQFARNSVTGNSVTEFGDMTEFGDRNSVTEEFGDNSVTVHYIWQTGDYGDSALILRQWGSV